MENEQKRYCNQCPNHCPEDALHCGRGRAYFGMTAPGNEGDGHRGNYDHGEGHSHGEGHGQGRPHGGMGMESESKNPLVQVLVKAAAIAEHKSSMMRMHGKDESTMFNALSQEEQEELAGLLNKVLEAWAADHARHHQQH